ncbi:MAG: dTDP-glucose 4,6-dehydratase [Myxococcota bacterium]
MRWIVTGGAGFIGSCFARLALQERWADEVVVADALTYAGNLANLDPVKELPGYSFVRVDICEPAAVERSLPKEADAVFHFAAESHVDRSIEDASAFIQTNVLGTQVLLDWAVRHGLKRFVHVSTDEVYGSLELDSSERFTETSPLEPTSPYAASKTASDHLVLAMHRTHGLDVVVTRCSNNYGPYQFPEKFIPLFLTNAMEGKKLPLYGDGLNVRDWIHVEDHARGIRAAFERGTSGAVYNLGGECERANRDIAHAIVTAVGADPSLIEFVKDRKAHDRRYAIDPSLAADALDFTPGPPIEERLTEVVEWYRKHRSWWDEIKSGAYRDYYERMYGNRGRADG